MNKIDRNTYTLLLSQNPCDLFTYYNVKEMHGLSITKCQSYNNNFDSAYIAGLSNFVPKESGEYDENDQRFVFINLSRCGNDVETMGLIMHEMMHHSFFIHNYDIELEEEIITWAEEEAYEVYKIITQTYGDKK
jgi:hypothetical protein